MITSERTDKMGNRLRRIVGRFMAPSAEHPVGGRRGPSVRRQSPSAGGDPPLDAFDDQAAAIVYSAYLGVWDREADRFWVRSNLLLLVNGALLGVVAGAQTPSRLKLIVCAFGVYFSIHWLLLNGKGLYYVARWRPAIEAYERMLLERPSFSSLPLLTVPPDEVALTPAQTWAERLAILAGRRPPVRTASSLMHAIVLGFVVAWLALAAYFAGSAIDAKSHDRTSSPPGTAQPNEPTQSHSRDGP